MVIPITGTAAFSRASLSQWYNEKTTALDDFYAAKGTADYFYRFLLNAESTSFVNVDKYFLAIQTNFGTQAIPTIWDVTLAGLTANIRAALDKLKNYDPVQQKPKSSPIADIADDASSQALEEIFNSIVPVKELGFNLEALIGKKIASNIFEDPVKLEQIKKGFYTLFVTNTESARQFDIDNRKYVESLWSKIQISGLLDLAVSVASIGEFARLRFNIGNQLTNPEQGSAAQALDPVRDTMWLTDLSVAIQQLSRDPITLAIIGQYFPNLVTLFFNAVAIAADYSGGSENDPINNITALAESLLGSFGRGPDGKPVFKAAWEFINTAQRVRQALDDFPFRENIQPKNPDIFHLRLGAANFYVPPVSININSQFKTGSLTSGAIRQKNTPKFNAGYKETSINIKLFFPNYEEIWGISIDGINDITLNKDFKIDFKLSDNEEKIDKFLSSLRGLVAAFKYAPFLPVKNHYLNAVHGISGVALSSMSISTIPNYPFALVVDLELLNFNHKPFLPMIKDFNQAVHWGKFRHYMGKAAGHLHSYINESFFIEAEDTEVTAPGDRGQEYAESIEQRRLEYGGSFMEDPYKDDIYSTNVIKEWANGNNISFYIPQQVQTKIFHPDTASFRSESEKILDETASSVWSTMLRAIGISSDQRLNYFLDLATTAGTTLEGAVSPSARRVVLESIDLIVAGNNQKEFNEKIYDYLATSFVLENKFALNQQEIDYMKTPANSNPSQDFVATGTVYRINGQQQVDQNDNSLSLAQIRSKLKESSRGAASLLETLAERIAEEKARSANRPLTEASREQARDDVRRAFNVLFYNRFFNSGPIRNLIENRRLQRGIYQFAEWEVPMLKVDIDPTSVIVNGVSVTLGNNLAKMQLQMQEEPTYQHIGGKDTYINISMTVFGEKELIKIRKVFEHINGLARLEHATGVIGFMGIKNIIAGLAGMKYVVPLTYQVDTIPNFPHVYDVRMSFVDFDIFQQQREKLSAKQQSDMINEFATKRNPFLRIKQLWGSFNAYPDFPLSVKNKDGETVGTLDPDYYFRSFEMFDYDVINNVTSQQENNFYIPRKNYEDNPTTTKATRDKRIMDSIKEMVQNDQTDKLKEFFEQEKIGYIDGAAYISGVIREFFEGKKPNLILDFIDEYPEVDGKIARFSIAAGVGSNSVDLNAKVGSNSFSDNAAAREIATLMQRNESQAVEGDYISIDLDELNAHHLVTLLPAQDDLSQDKVPALLLHSGGYDPGYVSKSNSRFYFSPEGIKMEKNDNGEVVYSPLSVPVTDADNPAKAYDSGISGPAHLRGVSGSNLSEHAQPYSRAEKDTPEGFSQSLSPSLTKHWERMLVDTQYRDISGRMIRAYPTYMLWLIDEGGYFAGVKLFDNFYGLQSIIDFSIVQSEDILGDTLILRVSNLYSKLTTPESSDIFNAGEEEYNDRELTQTDSLESILDKVLNRSRNILGHMENKYIVDINNIRLKPGVRVHLRAGYGANPNSLQTLFNGTITQVENGEIVTITAQSDAIELSPIVNSTNKKGDSGKIDGGINTGFWLSEPRDLMVRLLSMGSSRTREAIAHATRGTVFSENKFGIRHFGSILYEPLTEDEKRKNQAVTSQVQDALMSLGEGSGNLWGLGSAMGILASGESNQPFFGAGPEIRVPAFTLMQTLWANFSSQRDFEIFKRNIYPGNGTGIAQFLGGDLGDGWSTMVSLTPGEKTNERIEYIGRVTDYSWNNLVGGYGDGNSPGDNLVDGYTIGNKLVNNEARVETTRMILGSGVAAGGAALAFAGMPVVGGIAIGAGLLGVLSGRGGNNLFNTMGITSGMDDDLPGLDEVSFRAQTYMRSVWDLFQLCARLLPNYIVAIRPFEDRSTIFYGKPHWLYTSGVVPLTTGYPGDERAIQLGITTPAQISADTTFNEVLSELNKVSSPLADSGAFYNEDTSLMSLTDVLTQQLNPESDQSVYLPTQNFKGRVIAFGYDSSMIHKNEQGNPDSKLPTSVGFATIGYHLPIIPEGGLEAEVEQQKSIHAQIPQLPARYRFPFFTDREDSVVLEDYAYYALEKENLGTWNNHKADYMTLLLDNWSYSGRESAKVETNWTLLLKMEAKALTNAQTVDFSFFENENNLKIGLKLKNSSMPNFSAMSENLENADMYIYSERSGFGSTKIRMPLPDTRTVNSNNKAKDYTFIEQNRANNPFTLEEWKAPKTAREEQFYIAMRWPYQPSGNEQTIEQFIQNYGEYSPLGTAEDYQKRRVMVYSPTTGKAVVCKPAYFLWGKDDVSILQEDDEVSGGGRDEFGNPIKIKGDNGSSNNLALGESVKLEALVSPDAAFYLGMLNLTKAESEWWKKGESSKSEGEWSGVESSIMDLAEYGIAPAPVPRKCYYAFVPDTTPLGVVPDLVTPADEFYTLDGTVLEQGGEKKLLSFGYFKNKTNRQVRSNRDFSRTAGSDTLKGYYEFVLNSDILVEDYLASIAKGGANIIASNESDTSSVDGKDYFQLIKDKNFDVLDQVKKDYIKFLESDEYFDKDGLMADAASIPVMSRFADIYSEIDMVSVEARKLYDEDYSIQTAVLAGNGRTLYEARQIWDQFRFGYHTYDAVKEVFQRVYGLDPDDETDLGGFLSFGSDSEASAADFRRVESARTDEERDAALKYLAEKNAVFKKYGSTAEDEFSAVFGDSFFETKSASGSPGVPSSMQGIDGEAIKRAVELSRRDFIDASSEDSGLIEYFNDLINVKISRLKELISGSLSQSGFDEAQTNEYINSITTSKQLFLFLVGAFRNAMWSDPYNRAWLVLKPNRHLDYNYFIVRKNNRELWDFRPVHKMFQAFIDPNETYGKDPQKFKRLLAKNRGEGSSSSSPVGKAMEGIDGFWDRNIGPLFTALGNALQGLVSIFRMSMMQLGYGLSQVGQMSKQANILNKVLNDSIYYSLGRPGSLLRAVDNPFTREYGEPVVEVREPFQRIHYLSSFSHIIANGITENINGVATSVTAVSDGKYPVTVALDKSIPSERQVEKTVETGIFFDNATGSGLFGALHPILHPFEFARGISKTIQGTPDELTARRIALAHLRESLKDIYTGEIIVIGNPDIRPHDLIYLADVYERMYGIVEVEQVVHHFTSELGFITSITPNALVTVNDPARWFMSSWIGTWLHMQALRNDTRLYMNSMGSGISSMGVISVDTLAESLQPQMVGGLQYTHGSSALTKDVMAHFASESFADVNEQVKSMVKAGAAGTVGGIGAAFGALSGLSGVIGAVAAVAVPGAGTLVGVGAGLIGGGIAGKAAWKGWSWVRDNVLDQHGCYIQYLNRNGQPMDAGLNQLGQGMVVGRYHTKKLLPGILGTSSILKSPEGYSYIRTDDLLKKLGWKEKDISELVRHISFENALVNSQILKYSGISPDKAGLNRFFKVLCKVTKVVDGDTIDVVDVLDTSSNPFRVRFDGINTPELNVIKTDISIPAKTASIISARVFKNELILTTSAPHNFNVDDVCILSLDSEDNEIVNFNPSSKIQKVTQNTFTVSTPLNDKAQQQVTGTASVYATSSGDLINPRSQGGKAKEYTENALKDKIFVLRISPKNITSNFSEDDFDAGSIANDPLYYETDVFGSRKLGAIFYKAPEPALDTIITKANALFEANLNKADQVLESAIKNTFYNKVFSNRFLNLFKAFITEIGSTDPYFSERATQTLKNSNKTFTVGSGQLAINISAKAYYNAYISMKALEFIYEKVSEWPNVEWDEYYDDGTPATLNWELVNKNLAKVYTRGLLIEQPSVITASEYTAVPTLPQ